MRHATPLRSAGARPRDVANLRMCCSRRAPAAARQPAPQASRRFAHAAHAERAAHAAESDASTQSDNVLASHRAPPRSSRVAPCVTELVQRRPPATSQKARPSKSSYQRPRVLVGDGPHAGAHTNTACGARAVMETARSQALHAAVVFTPNYSLFGTCFRSRMCSYLVSMCSN